MGCPDIYYLQALQYMAHCLNYSKDKNKAKELSASKNITLLENHGTKPKNKYQAINTLGSNLAITVSSFP